MQMLPKQNTPKIEDPAPHGNLLFGEFNFSMRSRIELDPTGTSLVSMHSPQGGTSLVHMHCRSMETGKKPVG
jgi:hypothetical protein